MLLAICEQLYKGLSIEVSNNAPSCASINRILQECGAPQDADGDNVNNFIDNCIAVYNADQLDADGDGEGNACDSNSDTDNDFIVDSLDNCVTNFNPNQVDTNDDGQGDECDSDSDSDSDGRNDNNDNCPSIFNPDQKDCNNNNIGDVCEPFFDNDCDGISNSSDNCPTIFNPYQLDYNFNSIGDACENFPRVGLNNSNPQTEMQLSYSNLYLDHPEKGIILKAENNQCYKIQIQLINNEPKLKLVNIPCP